MDIQKIRNEFESKCKDNPVFDEWWRIVKLYYYLNDASRELVQKAFEMGQRCSDEQHGYGQEQDS